MKRFFSIALVLMNLADASLTVWALNFLNGFIETNPLMAWLINLSPWLFLGVKASLSPLFWYMGKQWNKGRISKFFILVCFLMYVVVLVNNVYWLILSFSV